MLGAEASSADVDFSFPSFYHDCSSMDIRQPASQSMLFGMAYIMPKLRFLATNLTLHRKFSTSLCYESHFKLSQIMHEVFKSPAK